MNSALSTFLLSVWDNQSRPELSEPNQNKLFLEPQFSETHFTFFTSLSLMIFYVAFECRILLVSLDLIWSPVLLRTEIYDFSLLSIINVVSSPA